LDEGCVPDLGGLVEVISNGFNDERLNLVFFGIGEIGVGASEYHAAWRGMQVLSEFGQPLLEIGTGVNSGTQRKEVCYEASASHDLKWETHRVVTIDPTPLTGGCS
jgi:hypothetical protein